jgi:hypothetical protein
VLMLPTVFADSEDHDSLQSQVCRGTSVMMVVPTSGMEEIANPFMQPEGA